MPELRLPEIPGLYILTADRVPVRADLVGWAVWFETSSRDGSRIVGNWTHKGVHVSTVFLGIDHAFGGGPPLLFETMIFGGPADIDQSQWRWSTWADAEAGHMATCQTLRARLDVPTGAPQ